VSDHTHGKNGPMGSIRSQVGWMLRGRANTVRTLDALSNDLRELQEKVAGLEQHLREIHLAQDALRERQLDEFDRVRAAVTDAVDDLATRIAAVDARR
jgi:predicted  nucleic acid-binding Zn-ribbon protein